MFKTAMPLTLFLVLSSVAASSYATLDRNRHTGTYYLDYSHTDNNGMDHNDYLIGSIHGALAYTSNWGNGATSFHWEFPLVPINDEMREPIEEARDAFIANFEKFVEDCDWQVNWFGDITYFNAIIQGSWKTTGERDRAKIAVKENAAAYAVSAVENAIENWNRLFEALPDDVHIDTAYGKGLFKGLGVGTFHFDGNSENAWPSGMVNNARLTLPYVVPHTGFLDGTQLPEGQVLGLGCLTWTAADEIGCFALAEGEPCKCEAAEETICADADGGVTTCAEEGEAEEEQEEEEICTLELGNCANQCTYGDETVDMKSLAGMVGELTCVGTVPGIVFGFDVGFGIAGMPRGTLETNLER